MVSASPLSSRSNVTLNQLLSNVSLIQGLVDTTKKQDATIRALKRENTQLSSRLDIMESDINYLAKLWGSNTKNIEPLILLYLKRSQASNEGWMLAMNKSARASNEEWNKSVQSMYLFGVEQRKENFGTHVAQVNLEAKPDLTKIVQEETVSTLANVTKATSE